MAAENRGPATPVNPDPNSDKRPGAPKAGHPKADTPKASPAVPGASVGGASVGGGSVPGVPVGGGSVGGESAEPEAGVSLEGIVAMPPKTSDPVALARQALEQSATRAAREVRYAPKAQAYRAQSTIPIIELLQEAPFKFDFFQAMRVLEAFHTERNPVGGSASPRSEVVRFSSHASLAFPASAIHEYRQANDQRPVPEMMVNFMGLYGPSGILPTHYTEFIMRLRRDVRGPERYAFRDFLDIFNHRWISLFYRASTKYRFHIPFERGEYDRQEQDPFTQAVFSLVGMGTDFLRGRMRVSLWKDDETGGKPETLAEVDDLALMHYAGLLSHFPRNAIGLETMLKDYFRLPVKVQQFQPQWLKLDPDSQSQLGLGSCRLGQDAILGERVLDVQGKFRIRIGPLDYGHFSRFLPDRDPTPNRKAFFLLVHLVRLYAGAEFDFDAQLILAAADVPELKFSQDPHRGPRLGWNTWLRSKPPEKDVEDAVFEASELYWVNEQEALAGRQRQQ